MKKIAFIGLGIMGKGMARNLIRAGYELLIYARDRAKVEDVISVGARFFPSIAAVLAEAEAVITIVGFPEDVEEIYLGPGGIIASAAPGTYLIDMTTSSPELAVRLAQAGKERGLKVLDAPVTGGEPGAKQGTLSILVGGARQDFEACQELFSAMGTTVNYFGGAGNGQHAKLANQIVIAGTLAAVAEGLTYAKAQGLNCQLWLESVATGAAGSRQLTNLGPKMLAGDYTPSFFLKHFAKDLRLAQQAADTLELKLGVLAQVLHAAEAMLQAGCEAEGTQALYKYYQK